MGSQSLCCISTPLRVVVTSLPSRPCLPQAEKKDGSLVSSHPCKDCWNDPTVCKPAWQIRSALIYQPIKSAKCISLVGGNSAKCLQKCELEIDNRMKVKPFEKKRRINIGWKRKMAWWAGIGWWLHTLHRDSCSGQPSTSLLVLQLEFSQLHNHAAINFGATGIESCLLMHPKVICSKSSFYSVTNYL